MVLPVMSINEILLIRSEPQLMAGSLVRIMRQLFGFLAAAMFFAASSADAAIQYADITGGRIKGEVNEGLASFKGVPFAAPPVGAFRWRAPQPVVAWNGTRSAETFAPACIQPWGGDATPPISEDCLYLNVWTAASTPKERRPVMVWIHGGGLTAGMSWERLSHGNKLAPEGVVLVTIAYRLGAIGFLAHPDLTRENGRSSGNYGLMDIVAALKWVQANIEQFGGDPSRVTIFGGSAGGVAVSLLAGASGAKGLYARAIAQGGVGFFPLPSLKTAEGIGDALFKSLGLTDLQAARQISAEKLIHAQPESPLSLAIIDGDLVQHDSLYLFEHGRFNDTPILVGFTSDEWGDPPPQASANWLSAKIARLPCERTRAAIETVYPHFDDEHAKIAARTIARDISTGWPTWMWARLQTSKGRNRAYLYYFDVRDREHPFGAPHAREYPYVFGNFPTPPTASDEATSTLMRKYWINFATNGDPNGPGLPVWKSFHEPSQLAMVFDESAGSRRLPNLDGLQAWNAQIECATPMSAGRFLHEGFL
jgi:para-nitrobenzyl esterase